MDFLANENIPLSVVGVRTESGPIDPSWRLIA